MCAGGHGNTDHFFFGNLIDDQEKEKIIKLKKKGASVNKEKSWKMETQLDLSKVRKITKQRLGKRFTHHLDFLACFHYRVVRGISQQ